MLMAVADPEFCFKGGEGGLAAVSSTVSLIKKSNMKVLATDSFCGGPEPLVYNICLYFIVTLLELYI